MLGKATFRIACGVLWLRDRTSSVRRDRGRFRCNICGRRTSWSRAAIGRETISCGWCGSTVRTRGLVAAFGSEVLGLDGVAPRWDGKRAIRGIGFSDQSTYARHFARLTTYANTWFHKEPRRDLTEIDTFRGESFDYVVCSEVLEHVRYPVELAIANIFKLLNPGGVAIISSPMIDGSTVEHYPPLIRWATEESNEQWVLKGAHADGGRPFETDMVIFHGGPGATVEMRVLGRESFRSAMHDAGFVHVREHPDVDEFGIWWSTAPERMQVAGGWAAGTRVGVWSARRPG